MRRLIGTSELRDGVYYFIFATSTSNSLNLRLWHQCLGHLSFDCLYLVPEFTNLCSKIIDKCCDVCHQVKQVRDSFSISNSKS